MERQRGKSHGNGLQPSSHDGCDGEKKSCEHINAQESIFCFSFVILFQPILHSLFLVLLCISCFVVYSEWVDSLELQCVKVSVIDYHSHLHDTPNLETIAPTKPTPD